MSVLPPATMDLLDDPFSTQPIPEDMDDGSFVHFIEGLAEEDNMLLDEPFPSVPIPLPHTAHMGEPDEPVDLLDAPFVPLPLDDDELPSEGASGASNTKATTKRTPKTAQDRLEKLRAKNRRGQAKYREKCKVRDRLSTDCRL